MLTTQSKDGTLLAYDKTGSATALLSITGAGCFRTMKPVMQDVKIYSEHFTVYNYDRRGRGDSSDTLPYSMEREVEDIEALIDAAGGKADVYGHSSGAVLALNAAMRMPNKIGKVVIYDPPYVADDAEKHSYGQLAQQVEILLRSGNNKAAMRTFLKGIGMPSIFIWLLPLFPGWSTMVKLAPTLMYDISMTKDFAPFETFRSISIPMLILVGEKSPQGMHQVAKRLAQSIPNAKYDVVAGQDHMVSAKILVGKFVEFFKPAKQTIQVST